VSTQLLFSTCKLPTRANPVVISEDEDEEEEDEPNSDDSDERFNRYGYARDWYARRDMYGHIYHSDTDGSLSGDPDAEYGGYGECYNCGRNGHWHAGCPF